MSTAFDIETMIFDLRSHLGVDENDEGFDEAGCLRILNRSFWEILNKFNFREKETYYTYPTEDNVRDYTPVTDFEAITLIAIESPTDQQHTPLKRTSIFDYENQYDPIFDQSTKGTPTNYIRYGNLIRLYPTPDQVYTITVYHLLLLENLDSTQLGIPVPREWYDPILSGGVYRGYKLLGNYNRAWAARQDQALVMDSIVPVQSKEEVDSPLSGLDVAGYSGDL